LKRIRVNIRVTELDTLVAVLIRLYKLYEELSNDVYLHGVMSEAEDFSVRMTTSIKSSKATSKLEALDNKRDEIIKLLFALIAGYQAIPVATKKAAAQKVAAVAAKYKGITSESYASESSLIESFLKDMSAEDMASAIAELEGVAEYVASLRSAQDEFNAASDELTAENTTRAESATSLKKPMLSLINDKFVPYLTAMAMSNSAVYGDFAAKAEAEITKMNDSIQRRARGLPAESAPSEQVQENPAAEENGTV